MKHFWHTCKDLYINKLRQHQKIFFIYLEEIIV